MTLRYADRKDILRIISEHPNGITSIDIARALWPEREGCDFDTSVDWTKKQIQNIRKSGDIESVGITGRSYLWRVRP